ncbi:MAG: regulatory protein RecX [Patescibacteria group bacterium]|nr:regulatory protein RecX [Patescibacteria group bacterium]
MKNDRYQKLLNLSFRYISVRPRTKQEMLIFLEATSRRHHIPQDIVLAVVHRLKELDYINDEKFAALYIRSSLHGKPKGKERIAHELKKRGVSDEIIQRVFQNIKEFHDQESEIAIAKKALGKRGEAYKTLPLLVCKRRIYDFLSRRGFSSSTIAALVDEYCETSYNGV